MRRWIVASVLAWWCALPAPGLHGQQGQQDQPAPQQELPRFTSSVEVTSLDVTVLDAQGRPVTDLTPDDFVVKVDNTPRHVVSADWVSLQTEARALPTSVPAGYSSNEGAEGGRLILIVVDQPNIRFGGTLGIRKAVNDFIDRLQPSDRVAVIGLGPASPSTSFTADHARLKSTVARLNGLYQPAAMLLHQVGIAEALDITRGDVYALRSVVTRECVDPFGRQLSQEEVESCQFEIEAEAREVARARQYDGRNTIAALRSLLNALRKVEGPKTMIFVSEGFLVDDMQQDVITLGTTAAAARTSIYGLRLDDSLFEFEASQARSRMPSSRMDNRIARTQGLEILASASRGALMNVVGNGANVFQRIETELAGYYLIGVESGAADKDGNAHPITVDVRRRGLTIRSRRAVVATPVDEPPRNPREAVFAALAMPLPAAALPLRIATYSLQGPEADRVQLLIHADIGTDYSSSRVVSLGYIITDRDGRTIDSQASTARLPPIMNGVPSPLQFAGGASLPPGDYEMKLAVAEGDRVGTVEHVIHAGTTEAGAFTLSDLMVGGPIVGTQQLLQPTVGYTVVFGTVHGYVEAYGPGSGGVHATFEVASTPDGPALVSAETPPYTAGEMRAIFSQLLLVRQLPPGKYYLRAALSAEGEALRTLTTSFEVATPAVLMTSATTAESAVREVYLPVTESMLAGSFDLESALRPETVRTFRDRVASDKRAEFDRGVQALQAKSFPEAETRFKGAVTPDDESTAALTYLAVTFAASGHDTEAASAWQTALADGSDLPEIYEWLASALMRRGDLAMARTMLEEAIAKWPSDPRFFKPMALVYATFGQGQDAVRHLERHIQQHPDDVPAMLLGVEWIYQLRSAGGVSRSPAEDLALARKYAAGYAETKGSQTALVQQWIEFLERQKQ